MQFLRLYFRKLHLGNEACALFLLCLTTGIPSAQTFATIHNFDNADGANPGSLIQATDGKLYGSAYFGSDTSSCNTFCGTLFKITRSGTLTLLYTFCTLDGCADGDVPGPLMQATDGNFYGSTQSGGTNLYDGTVFKITPSGTLTTLHNFSGADGSVPEGVMV
ncbi:MAG: choice-of-anchor tandem repeat GloVer-containing protein [Terriglobales bacterium]